MGIALPITIIVVIAAFIGTIIWLVVRGAKRRRALAKARSLAIANLAPQLGLSLANENGILQPKTRGFSSHLFSLGTSQLAHNALEGTSSGLKVVLFDYQFEETRGEESVTILETVAAFASPKGPLPSFVLKKRGLFSRLSWHKVEIDGNPDFARRFILNGSEGPKIKQLFSPSAAGFLASSTLEEKYVLEAAGTWLFLHGSQPTVENLPKFLEETSQLANGFFQNCGVVESIKAS